MKKILAMILCLTMVLALAACGSSAPAPASAPESSATDNASAAAPAAAPAAPAAQPQVVKMAHTGAETTLMHKSFLVCKEYIEEHSNGALTVQIYPNGQLGAEADLLQATQSGDIQMMATNNGYLLTVNPLVEVFTVPFAFPSEEIAYAVLDGEFGQKMLATMENYGLKGLGYYESSDYRELTANKPINTVEDLKGLKIRVMPNNLHVKLWESLGCSPATISFGELYTALQQHTVDAQENPVELMLNSGFPEVQSYLIRTNHIFSNGMMVGNPAWFNALTPELQQVVIEGVQAGQNYWRAESTANRVEYYKQAEAAGMTVIELDESVHEQLQELAKPVVDMIAADVGQDLVDELFAAVAAEVAKQ